MSSAHEFWAWFAARAKSLTWPPPHELVDEIGERIHAIDPGLAFELSNSETIVLAISAAGMAELFERVEEIVAAAPAFDHVRVVAFRQRGKIADATLGLPDGGELSCDDIWFRVVTASDPVELELYVRGFPAESPGQMQEAVYLLLDNALGEFDVVKHIAGIDWHELPKDPVRAALSPLKDLPAQFDRALKRPLRS